MGESSTCLVRSFCTTADTCSKQENPIHMLGESISFGRFMSESLDWEKWSAFSHNRYVEEAEKYSKPGSVAAKKAYFEAHYKKKAAEKAAALIEEANAQANGTFVSETQEGNCIDSSLEMRSKTDNIVTANEQPDTDTVDFQVVDCANMNQSKCDIGQSDFDILNVDRAEDVPHPHVDTNLNVENCTLVDNSDQFDRVEVLKNIAVPVEEMTTDPGTAGEEVLTLPLKGREVNSSEELSNKTRAATKLSHSLDEKKAAAAVPPRSGTNCGSKSKKLVGDSAEKKLLTAGSLRMSINLPSGAGEKSKTVAAAVQSRNGINSFSTSKKSVGCSVEKKRITAPSLYKSINLPSSAGVTSQTATAAVKPRNGINHASKSMKSVGDSIEKRPVARSLHMSINLSSGAGQTSETASVFEPNRTKKLHSNLVNISKDQNVSSQISTKASHDLLNQASANPPSQGRRTERLQNKSVFGGVTANAKLSSISVDCLKSGSITKNSPRTPTISTPFRFRSEERAVKRKEFLQRMDEIKSKEEEKVQLQRTPKISLTLPRSPKLVRKACSSTVHDNNYFGNSWKPPISTNNSKRITEKVNRTSRQSVTSFSNTTRENASPNIQQ